MYPHKRKEKTMPEHEHANKGVEAYFEQCNLLSEQERKTAEGLAAELLETIRRSPKTRRTKNIGEFRAAVNEQCREGLASDASSTLCLLVMCCVQHIMYAPKVIATAARIYGWTQE